MNNQRSAIGFAEPEEVHVAGLAIAMLELLHDQHSAFEDIIIALGR